MQFPWSAWQAFCDDHRASRPDSYFFCCFFIRFRCRKALASSQSNRQALSQSLFHGAKLQQRLIPMPLLISSLSRGGLCLSRTLHSTFMNIFNLLAIKRHRKWISIIASWRKLTYDGEEKKDKRFHLENQVDCCVLSSYLFPRRRLLFPSQCASCLLASSRRWKIQFGCSERNFLSLL